MTDTEETTPPLPPHPFLFYCPIPARQASREAGEST